VERVHKDADPSGGEHQRLPPVSVKKSEWVLPAEPSRWFTLSSIFGAASGASTSSSHAASGVSAPVSASVIVALRRARSRPSGELFFLRSLLEQ